MAGTFTVKILQDGLNKAQEQAKNIDAQNKQLQKNLINQEKQNLAIRKNTFKQIHANELNYAKKSIAIGKQVLATMSKDDRKYWDLKAKLARQSIGLTNGLSQKELATLKKSSDKAVEYERIAYNKKKEIRTAAANTSVNLAQKLQDQLKSVFQRAVFYTAIYRGIQLVNQAFRDWISTNVELDYALAKVNTIAQTTTTQIARLTDLSIESGRSLVDLTNALYEINSAGITGARAMRVLEVSTKAAVGGFVDAKSAADTLTDVLNAYHKGVNETEAVSDKLLKTVELGKLKWEEFQGQLGSVLPTSYKLGVSLDELLGSISTLTLAGIPLNKALTGLRNIQIKLLKPTKGMDKAMISLNKELGTNYKNVQDIIKSRGMLDTFRLLETAMQDAGLETTDLFNNIRGLTAQYALMSDAGLKASINTEKIANATGTTNEKMDIMADTIKETTARMSSSWDALGKDMFTFGDKVKWIFEKFTSFILLLRDFTPIIKGVAITFGSIGIAFGIFGVKILSANYLLPIFATSITRVNVALNATAISSKIAGSSIGVYTKSMYAATLGTKAFSTAMSVATLGLPILLLGLQAFSSWLNKTREKEQALHQSHQDMINTFREMRNEANLLSKVRPFAGTDIGTLSKQIAENNEKLKRREVLLKSIAEREEKLIKYRNQGLGDSRLYQKVNNKLAKHKDELYYIEGYHGRNLDAMKAQSIELEYQQKGYNNIQAAVEEISKGFTISSDMIKDMSPDDLKKGVSEIEKKIESLNKNYIGSLLTLPLFKHLKKSLEIFKKVIKEQDDALQKIKDEDNQKALDKQKDFMDKYNNAILSKTIKGRLQIIRNERDAALLQLANDENYAKNKATINQFYRDKETEEWKKFHDNKTQTYLQFINKVLAEGKRLDDIRTSLRDKYILTDTEKINAKYDKDLDLLKESNASKAEQNEISNAIELERDEALTESKIAQWRKQHEFYAWTIDSITSLTESSIQTILDTEASAAEKREAIWTSTKNLIINSFAEIVSKWIQSRLLQLAIEKTSATATIAVNTALTASYKALGAAMALTDFGVRAVTGATAYITSLASVTAANIASPVGDAIVQDGVITPFRPDDLVMIGTNLYGSRSGAGGNTGGIEKRLESIESAINDNTIANMKKVQTDTIVYQTPEGVYAMSEQGKKLSREA
jgi:TP901 family phage tail tape measure protein